MTVKISTSINALLAGALSSADALTGISRLSPPGQYTPEQGREDPDRTDQYRRFEQGDQKLQTWADMPVPPLLSSFAGEAQASGANGPKVQRIPSTSSEQGTMRSTLPPQRLSSSQGAHLYAPVPRPSYPPTPYYHWHRYRRPNVPTVRWLIIAISFLLIIAGMTGGLTLLLPPTLSLTSSVVRQGDTLHLHGAGFIPDSRVTLTLDGHLLPLSLADLKGIFNVGIVVSPNWSFGSHTLRATESVSARSAQVSFSIVARPGKLLVNPASLDFGFLQQGSTATQLLTVSNTGQEPLNWTANVGTATWLTLDSSAGTLQPGTLQTIHVTADASGLSVRKYSATLAISIGSESRQLGVSLVIKAAPIPSPTPTSTQAPPQQSSTSPAPPRPKHKHHPTPTPTPMPTPTPTMPPLRKSH